MLVVRTAAAIDWLIPIARSGVRFRPCVPCGKEGWGAEGCLDLGLITRMSQEEIDRHRLDGQKSCAGMRQTLAHEDTEGKRNRCSNFSHCAKEETSVALERHEHRDNWSDLESEIKDLVANAGNHGISDEYRHCPTQHSSWNS